MKVFTSYLLKYLHVSSHTCWDSLIVSKGRTLFRATHQNNQERRWALQGRYSCIAQGTSPGLIIGTHLLSPKGAALPRSKTNARVIVPLLRSSISLFISVYPGFHIGLCPHFTLGFAGVPCLKALVISLNFDALALILKVRCTHRNKYDVLTDVSARTYFSEYTHLNL